MSIRPRPTPDITLVFHPQQDASYVHFLDGDAHPFDPAKGRLGRRNAWWLADAALLSYWPPDEVRERYGRAGFDVEPLFGGTTQCYLAWNDQAVIVTFRGTEPGEPGDILDDLTFAVAPWDRARAVRAPGLQDRAGQGVAHAVESPVGVIAVAFGLVCRPQPGRGSGRAGGRPLRRRHGRGVHPGRAPSRRHAVCGVHTRRGSARAPSAT